jgi:hypothetical protein
MELKHLFLALTACLLIVGLTGCTTTTNYEESILGRWSVGNVAEGEEGSVIFAFYDDGNYSITATLPDETGNLTTTTLWYNYTINNEFLTLTMVGVEERLSYAFSSNGTILTLTEDNGTETVLYKI